MIDADDWTCSDGLRPEPFTAAELAGIRKTMDLYPSTDLLARALATIDDDEPIVGVPV